MTESEAIEKLKNMRLFMQIEDEKNDCKFTEDDYKANEMAIQALEEVQQYHAVGTPEECQKAVEKQIPQKPSNESLDGLNCFPICPNCHQGLNEDERESFCECGQRLDWSDEE